MTLKKKLPKGKVKHQKIIPILDAGHGGVINGVYQTAGKRSPKWDDGSQYFEGEGNRLIRAELISMLEEEGIDYRLVDDSNSDLPLSNRVVIINNIAKELGAGNCLLISIHSDAFNKPSAHGWSVFTTKGETASDKFATALYEEMVKEFDSSKFRTDHSDGDPDKESQFYIIRKTDCPAILSENFFMTNEKECKEILMTEWGRKKIARAHFNMIKRFV